MTNEETAPDRSAQILAAACVRWHVRNIHTHDSARDASTGERLKRGAPVLFGYCNTAAEADLCEAMFEFPAVRWVQEERFHWVGVGCLDRPPLEALRAAVIGREYILTRAAVDAALSK